MKRILAIPTPGCIQVGDSLKIGTDSVEYTYTLEYKMCYAKIRNNDGTESTLIVYLQSAFKQPLIGGHNYFVLFLYLFDQTTRKWVRPKKPFDQNNVINGKFRYEAYLSL